MFNSKKPLFSRPALAAVMVLSTLVIWVLNLTAPEPSFPTPKVETWKTDSGIPVIWLSQEKWKNTNKLELRFAFKDSSQNTPLTDATFSLLMADSLPLSTSTINQRLAPLAAKVSSNYDHESQTIALTINSEPAYLMPTLALLSQWISAPAFKARAFDRWNRQFNNTLPTRQQLEQQLFVDSSAKNTSTVNTRPVTLAAVKDHYIHLTQQASAIFIIGEMTAQTQNAIQASLNTLSEHLSPANPVADEHTLSWRKTVQAHVMQSNAIQGSPALPVKETQSMLALTPISSVKQWLSLQIWGADLIDSLSNQGSLGYVRLNLTLSAKHPWAYWRAQHNEPLLKATQTAQTNNTPQTNNATQASHTIYARSMIDPDTIPSVQDKTRFNALLDQLKNQLAQRTLDPSWWSQLATSATQEDSALTLAQFAKHYQDAIATFNQDDYQAALKTLFITPSYQEIQVH